MTEQQPQPAVTYEMVILAINSFPERPTAPEVGDQLQALYDRPVAIDGFTAQMITHALDVLWGDYYVVTADGMVGEHAHHGRAEAVLAVRQAGPGARCLILLGADEMPIQATVRYFREGATKDAVEVLVRHMMDKIPGARTSPFQRTALIVEALKLIAEESAAQAAS